jgi:hypothetical protein
VKDPLITRLLQVAEDFQRRHGKAERLEEAPMTPRDVARELKKLRHVDEGLAIIAGMHEFFLGWAAKFDSAFTVYGIPLLKVRSNEMRMLADSIRDDQTAIRTLVQIGQERTRKAAIASRTKATAGVADRRAEIADLCKENHWSFDAYALAARLEKRLAKDPRFRGKGNKPVSRRTIASDLIFLASDDAGRQ